MSEKKDKSITKERGAKMSASQLRELESTRKTMLAKLYAVQVVNPELLEQFFPFMGTTHWEELLCVGFNPQASQLEAVVSIKQTSGYSGSLCTRGTMEYIRFFIDWQDGAGFQDAGLTSFRAHDISDAPPGPQHPIDHMVYLQLDDAMRRKCCKTSMLPRVRAVLAWNQIPPLNPNFVPAFGNRRDATVQVQPKFTLSCLLTDQILDASVLEPFDPIGPLKMKALQPVAWSQLQKQYKADKIPDHRLVYDAVGPLFHGTEHHALTSLQPDFAQLATLGLDIAAILKALADEKANTNFEELVCAGLNTATDTLGAVIHVKKNSGYSGSLCQTGSKEYVAFWADWDNNGSYDEYLGTANVDVHDISDIPDGGLYYGVFLPVNVSEHLKRCANPNIVRIRAVLSWSVPPSTSDPDQLTSWGNRIDRLVRVRHERRAGQGLLDLLYSIGSVPIDDIDPVSFLANPSAGLLNPLDCSQPAKDRPYGGRVDVKGRIYNTGTPGSVHYQVQYAPHGTGSWLPVTNTVSYRLAHPNPFDPLHPVEVKTVMAPDGWFPYQEDETVSPPILEESAFLASWNTGNLEGVYDLRLAYTTDYPGLNPLNILYSDVVSITLDNTDYVASLTANAVVDVASTLDIVIDGGDCHSYPQGDVIQGHLRALDQHFWHWTLELQPSTHTHGLLADPQCRSYGSLIDAGDANAAWALHTEQGGKMLDKCGYTLTIRAYDRAILNSNGSSVHTEAKSVGFSIV